LIYLLIETMLQIW